MNQWLVWILETIATISASAGMIILLIMMYAFAKSILPKIKKVKRQ